VITLLLSTDPRWLIEIAVAGIELAAGVALGCVAISLWGVPSRR